MKNCFVIAWVLFIFVQLTSCSTGYKKENDQWAWVSYDESAGKRVHWIEGIDNTSFRVLEDKNFGTDAFSVYYKGYKIIKADPKSFTILTKNDYGYAKDKTHVFLNTEVVLKADPDSFTILEFPYAKDKNDVFNGTIPMNLTPNEVGEFEVVNEKNQFTGSISTIIIKNFIEFNPEYQWIESFGMGTKNVIVGAMGKAKTSTKKFKGFKEE